MGFFSNIPSMDVKTFMRNFSYQGSTREDIDRRGSFGANKFSRDYISVPERIKNASRTQNLDTERFGKYGSSKSAKSGWFEGYKSSLKKSFNGLYHENYSRYSNENTYSNDIDISKSNTHRKDNIHYNVKPVNRNYLSGA